VCPVCEVNILSRFVYCEQASRHVYSKDNPWGCLSMNRLLEYSSFCTLFLRVNGNDDDHQAAKGMPWIDIPRQDKRTEAPNSTRRLTICLFCPSFFPSHNFSFLVSIVVFNFFLLSNTNCIASMNSV